MFKRDKFETTLRIAGLAIFMAIAMAVGSTAHAQTAGTVNLTASPTSGLGSVTTTLTWSTTPAASSCTASGGWSGSKASSGSQAQPAATSTKDYTLTCSWPGSAGTATVSWIAPTTNTNGTALTDLAGFNIVFGTSASSLTQQVSIANPQATSGTVGSLTPGTTYFFGVLAVNSKGATSDMSNVASKLIVGGTPPTASKTVTVTVDSKPSPPTSTTVIETTAFNLRIDEQRMLVMHGQAVGRAPLGAGCDETRVTADGYTAISRPSRVKLYPSVSPRPTTIVAICG